MSTLALPNTIINGASGDATKVQQNFDAVVADSNTNLIKKDGTTAMTSALTLVAASPTLGDHAVRKTYSDAGDAAAIATAGAASTAAVAAEAVLRAAGDVNPAQHGAGITRAAAQNIAVNTTTLLAFDTVVWSSNAAYVTVPSNVITVPAADGGVHLVTFDARVPIAGNIISVELLLNGAPLLAGGLGYNALNTFYAASGSALYFLAAGDTLSVQVRHSAGGTLAWTGRLSVQKQSV